MSDPRRDAARRAYGAAPDKLFDRIYAVMEALRAYDAAHPQPEHREEVVQHSGQPSSPTDKSAAPLVGAAPRKGELGIGEPCKRESPPLDEKDQKRLVAVRLNHAISDDKCDICFLLRLLRKAEDTIVAARQPRPITDAMVEAARKYLAEDTPIDMREIAIGVLEAAERARVDG